jgi:hypothetical protein
LNKNKIRASESMNVTKGSIMKKMILIGAAILALAGASLQSARAGDREWATVGKVLTGVLAFNIVAHAIAEPCHPPACAYSAPACCPPPCNYTYCPAPAPQVVYCAPPPVVYAAPVVIYPAPRVVYYRSYRGCW